MNAVCYLSPISSHPSDTLAQKLYVNQMFIETYIFFFCRKGLVIYLFTLQPPFSFLEVLWRIMMAAGYIVEIVLLLWSMRVSHAELCSALIIFSCVSKICHQKNQCSESEYVRCTKSACASTTTPGLVRIINCCCSCRCSFLSCTCCLSRIFPFWPYGHACCNCGTQKRKGEGMNHTNQGAASSVLRNLPHSSPCHHRPAWWRETAGVKEESHLIVPRVTSGILQ